MIAPKKSVTQLIYCLIRELQVMPWAFSVGFKSSNEENLATKTDVGEENGSSYVCW